MNAHDAPHLPEPPDGHPAGAARFTKRSASFDYAAGGGVSKRLVGFVEAARYLGRTRRGAIPDYELTIRGESGRILKVSLVESRASFE